MKIGKTLSLLIFFAPYLVQAQKLPNLIPYRAGKLWGYCDSNKRIIIKPKYDLSKPEYKGFVILPFFGDETERGTVNLGKREFFIDRTGKEFEKPKPVFVNGAIPVPEDYNPMELIDRNSLFYENYFVALKDSEKYGKCKYEIPVYYPKDGYNDSKSFRCFSSADNSKTLVDEHDSVIYKGYKFIWVLDTVFLLVDMDDKWSIGNRFGNIITGVQYDEIIAGKTFEAGPGNRLKRDNDRRLYNAYWGKFLVVRKGIYYGVITLDNKRVIALNRYKGIKVAATIMYGIFYAYDDKYDGYMDYKGTQYWNGQNAGKPTPNSALIRTVPDNQRF